MEKFEVDFGKMKRRSEAEKAKRILHAWVGTAMIQLFALCICVLIILFWTNKFTLFLLALMTLFLAVILMAVYTTNRNYKSKLKAMEDDA
jgi:ABC-type bacteriocin/lantibiotic exporter with double-glycine peptidase domain